MLQPVNSTASPPPRKRACKFAFAADDHSVTSGASLKAAARQRVSASGALGALARGMSVPPPLATSSHGANDAPCRARRAAMATHLTKRALGGAYRSRPGAFLVTSNGDGETGDNEPSA